jgi:hypothetical protein
MAVQVFEEAILTLVLAAEGQRGRGSQDFLLFNLCALCSSAPLRQTM